MSRILLYLDVDGPLNPYAAEPTRRPAGYTTHRMKPEAWIAQHPHMPRSHVRPLRVWLNPDHGRRLLELGGLYDLVWATTWGREANVYIGPVLGLPELPVVDWPVTHEIEPAGRFWKTRHIVAHAAGRTFAWVDDELGAADRAFVAAHHHGAALLRHIDPRLGLLDADFGALDAFGRTHTGPA